MAIDIRSLRYFSTVATARSFTRASEQLHVAQPALSLQVRKVEEHLGVTLLIRTSKGVELTPAGDKFLMYALDIIRRLEAACDDVRASVAEPMGVVTVGMVQSLSEIITVPLVKETLRRWPKISLQVIELNTGYIPEFLSSGRIDLGMTFSTSSTPAISYQHLVDEELVFVGPADAFAPIDETRWTQSAEISLADISRKQLVMPMHSLREQVELHARRRQLRLDVVVEVTGIPQLIQLVHAGVGYTILSYPSVREALKRGTVSAARICAPPITRPVYLCRMAGLQTAHAVSSIEGLIVDIVRTLVSNGKWPGRLASDT